MSFDFWPWARSALNWLTSEMPGQTLTIVLTVILVPAIQRIYSQYSFKGSRASLLGMMDKHFGILRRGIAEQDVLTIVAEAAILDELMRTVAATMRPEMIRKYNDYLRDLIRNQGSARDLKYLSARLIDSSDSDEDPQSIVTEIQRGFKNWQEHFGSFRKHFQ